MISAYLSDKETWAHLITNPTLRTSVEWLAQRSLDAKNGDYQLGKDGWYVNVHSYNTRTESACTWESHAHTIDIQYLISGEEGIRWLPAAVLRGEPSYIANKDRYEWPTEQKQATMLVMQSGMFVMFNPGEGHRPMIALNEPMFIRRAVVKIPIAVLGYP